MCVAVPRNAWKDAAVVHSDDYRAWAEAGGEGERRVVYVDLNALVATRYDALGRSAVAPFFPADDTHTSRAGAS